MRVRSLFVLAALAGSSASPPTLIDHPIASPVLPVYLDGEWTATHESASSTEEQGQAPIRATVPGDIITDLQRAGVVPDPYYNTNWRDPAFIAAWNSGTWSYTIEFDTRTSWLPHAGGAGGDAASHAGAGGDAGAARTAILLVFDGIRMGARITLNGVVLGTATNQFVRYKYDVLPHLIWPGGDPNVLTVEFDKNIATHGRFTYASQVSDDRLRVRVPRQLSIVYEWTSPRPLYILSPSHPLTLSPSHTD